MAPRQNGFGFRLNLNRFLTPVTGAPGVSAQQKAEEARARANAARSGVSEQSKKSQEAKQDGSAGRVGSVWSTPRAAPPRKARDTLLPTKSPSMPAGDLPSDPIVAVGESAAAGLKAMQNTIFMGQDDKLIAGVQTLMGSGGDGSVVDRFQRNLATQEQRSQEVAEQHPIATSVGSTAGVATGLIFGNPLVTGRSATANAAKVAAKARPKRIPPPRFQTKPREYATVAAVAGAGNSAAEGAVNKVAGRNATVGDYAGTAIGGAGGALATFVTGARGGAVVEGALTPLTQDLLNGRTPSIRDISNGAIVGLALGHLGEIAALKGISKLNSKQKGNLGEALSAAKTFARLDIPQVPNWRKFWDLEQKINLEKGGFTKADQITRAREIVEAKFGRSNLTDRQKQARAQFPDRYRVDRWLPGDVGKIGGTMFGSLGTHPIFRDDAHD